MLENLKLKTAHFILKRKYWTKNSQKIPYNNSISGSTEFFVIMPADDKDFYHSADLLKYLLIHKKDVTLFLPSHKQSLILEKEKYKFKTFTIEMVSKLNLPKKELVQKLESLDYDVVIDLNRGENIFSSCVANIVKSKLRISFKKEQSGKYYNLIYSDSSPIAEANYRNFIKFLEMF